MSSFYFHIKFELYSNPHSKTSSALLQNLYPPVPGTDIFEDPLHPYDTRLLGEAGSTRKRKSRRKNEAKDSGLIDKSNGEDLSLPTRQQFPEGPSSNQAQEYRVIASNGDISPEAPSTSKLDRRFDSIAIESINFLPTTSRMDSEKATRSSNDCALAGSADIYTKARYEATEPQDSEVGWGIVHLYREVKEIDGLDDDLPSKSQVGAKGRTSAGDDCDFSLDDCNILCILGVPRPWSPIQFLKFVGERGREEISHIRMIRTSRRDRYMVLMKFRSSKKAREWRKDFNGRKFDRFDPQLQPDICHVVFVKSIEFQTKVNAGDESSSPDLNNAKNGTSSEKLDRQLSSNVSLLEPHLFGPKALAPPTRSLLEMPSCVVCLERMDDTTTGLLTILCQHGFHRKCIEDWTGDGCPTCRFTHADGNRTTTKRCDVDVDIEKQCSVCTLDVNLWICMICSNVGCGRYDGAHAIAHFHETSHRFALQVDTDRIWDYVGDAYVHQILLNKADGQMLNPTTDSTGSIDAANNGLGEDLVARQKLENVAMDYTHMLTSQLESQQMYYEEQMDRLKERCDRACASAERASQTASETTQGMAKLQLAFDDLAKETLPSVEKDKDRAERRAEKFETMARKMEKEWREEKAMNENLRKRVDLMGKETASLKEKITSLEEANAELTETNRDMTFFISSQDKLKDQGEDVQEGTVTIADAPAMNKGKKGKGKGKAKGK